MLDDGRQLDVAYAMNDCPRIITLLIAEIFFVIITLYCLRHHYLIVLPRFSSSHLLIAEIFFVIITFSSSFIVLAVITTLKRFVGFLCFYLCNYYFLHGKKIT